jgi:DNA-binding CsgD family transcriptional regulator
MLEALGLDTHAEQVYRTILANPGWGVTELGEHLVLPEQEVRAALDRLFELTLLSPSLEAPGALRPVSPDVGLSALLATRQAELARRQEQIAASQAAIAGVVAEYAGLRPESAQPRHRGVEHLGGLDAVASRLEQLAMHARSECLSFMPGGGHSAASLAASRPLDETALGRGVSLRTIYESGMRDHPPTAAYAHWLVQTGGAVRTTPALPTRMVLVDREVALLPADPGDRRAGAVQITGPGMIAALLALFEQVWATANPFGGESESAGHGLTEQQRDLLQLLGQGLTDDGAAKRIGVSGRTARRMVAELMERLGARSRFEAGVRAARRGWL